MRRWGGDVRTYGDLLKVRDQTCQRGTCCACHKWDKPTWQLSTRASICRECCERKSAQVLGSIVTAERRARRWVKGHPNLHNSEGAKFIANLCGLSIEFINGLIEIHIRQSPENEVRK